MLLIGATAAGKTTIASMLSVAALDQWGCYALKLDDAGKVIERWNTDEPSQFFWIDDAFGVTQYESYLAHRWNRAFQQVKAMLKQGVKVVMTSRDYIYKRARNDLKEGAFPLLRESQVVIDVHELTLEERQQILYNHLKMGRQSIGFRKRIKPHLRSITEHPRFIPETARRLGDPMFTVDLDLDRGSLSRFVEKQEQLLQEVITGLDEHSKAALALIFMRNGVLESPIAPHESEREAIERLGSSVGGCSTALGFLNGTLVQYVQTDSGGSWRFKHPTVGDAYASILLHNPEWLGIYVRGSSAENLIDQITCGDVGLERAVALPQTLFPEVLAKLTDFLKESTAAFPLHRRQNRLDYFLTRRCASDFLAAFINKTSILERVAEPGLGLSACSEVDLAIRLHELGILPEECRKAFVEKVVEYAMDGDDLYAIESRRIQSVFTKAELDQFRKRVRKELIPNLFDVSWHWKHDFLTSATPEEHMAPLLESYDALKKEFADDPNLVRMIESEIESLNAWGCRRDGGLRSTTGTGAAPFRRSRQR